MTIDSLRELLRNKILTVTFEKKDGSIREMLCTTMADHIPDVSNSSTPSESLVTVWDLENEGWRSFRFDSLKSIYVD